MKKSIKKIISLLLVTVMITGVVPNFGMFTASAKYNNEYYYTNGQTFLSTDMAVSLPNKKWYGTVSGSAEDKLDNNGYTRFSIDLNDGAGGEYIYFGYKTTTDTSKAIRGLGCYNGSNPPTSYSVSINGTYCTYYPVKGFHLNSDSLSDVPVDLNSGAGGDYVYLYYTTDPNAGPPLTAIDYEVDSTTNDSGCQTPVNWLNTNGEKGVEGEIADFNAGAGGDYIYFFVHSSVDTKVDTASLRTAISNGNSYISNSSKYVSVSAVQSAVNSGNTIISDYDADGLSCNYDQTAINNATTAINSAINALQTRVTLNANGGTIGTTSVNVTVGTKTTFSFDTSSYVPTRTGYTFMGWSTSSSATTGTTGSLTLGLMPTIYAIWQANTYNVTFDNLVDFKAWNKAAGNGTVSDVTDTGFTITSDADAGEATSSSPFFAVEPGKSYKIDIDFEGDGWDVYIFFCDADGNWIDFADGASNRYSSNNSTGIDKDNAVFTAPNKSEVVKAQIRVDANGAGNTVRFDNIRVYEVNDVSVSPVNKYVTYDSTYGTLPTPTKPHYDFIGWYRQDGTKLEATEKVDILETLYVNSVWTPHVYNIMLDENGGSEVADTTYTIEAGTVPSAPVKTGFTFSHWEVASTTGNWSGVYNPGASAVGMYGDVTLKAIWTANKYTVTWVNEAGVSIHTQSVEYGAAIPTDVIDVPAKQGYTGEWNYSGYTTMPATNITVKPAYTITSEALVPDVYVLDFGLNAELCPLDNDEILANDGGSYTISAVSITENGPFSDSVVGNCGRFSLSGNDIIYTPYSFLSDSGETIYYQVEYERSGEKLYLVSSVRIIPATVVYYEDDYASAITYADGTSADGSTGKWATVGNSSKDSATQSVADDVYGYDSIYAESTENYSMGSAHIVSVSKYNNPNSKYSGSEGNSWPVAQFTFAGTGFDLVSLISKETGAIEVRVFSGTDTSGKAVYNWIVDTYYGYTYTDGEWVVSENAQTALYQIPVIGRNDLAYGTYTVQIIPTYTTRLDHQKDGVYDFYLDAIRVYEPMGSDSEASSAYAGEGEYVILHQSIRDILIDAKDLDANGDSTGIVYINPGVTEGTFEQYSKAGPKNEVYLAAGQSVAFNMTVEGVIPSSVQVSVHSLDGAASMRFASGDDYSDVTSITHKTTLYYEIPFMSSDCWTDNGNGTYTTKHPLVITNNGDGLLSLCNIKVTTDGATAAPVMFAMNSDTFAVAAASAETASVLSADDGALFVPDDVAAGTDTDIAAVGEDVVVTVSTSKEVHALTVNGENAVLVSENGDGTKTWSYTYTADSRGEQTFTLVAYNADGFASEETTVTVEVQSRIEIFFNKLSHIFSLIVEFIDKLF